MKKTINVDMLIEYDDDKETIDNYEIRGNYTLAEIAVIVGTFKHCLKDWGYEVKLIEE